MAQKIRRLKAFINIETGQTVPEVFVNGGCLSDTMNGIIFTIRIDSRGKLKSSVLSEEHKNFFRSSGTSMKEWNTRAVEYVSDAIKDGRHLTSDPYGAEACRAEFK